MNWNDADWWQVAIWIAVAWAAIGGLWRPAGVVLVGAWLALELYYLATMHFLPVGFYMALDLMILTVLWRWGTSKLDAAIAVVIPVAWFGYLSEYMGWLSPYQTWWLLWHTMMAQLFLAGPFKEVQHIGADLARIATKGQGDVSVFARNKP